MKAFHTSTLKKWQPAEAIVFVTLLILALSLSMAWGQEAPGGYLARGLGGFKLSEAPPPKRPTKPLPPLPIAYNPQPSRSGHTAKPITQTAAQSEFRASSETHFLTPGRSEGGTPIAPVTPIMPQQSMLNPQTLIHMFQGADGNTTMLPLNTGPSLYQLPAFPIRGSNAEYIRK